MRVLGIDPGTRLCGWGVVEVGARSVTHVAHGVVRLTASDLSERLDVLFEGLEEVIRTHRPAEVAVEGVFTQKNVRSALILGHARGVALLCAGRAGLPVSEYAPATIKKVVVGTGRAEKAQVQRMVGTWLGIEDPEVADAADALAAALCHLQHASPAAAGGVQAVVRHRKNGRASATGTRRVPVRRNKREEAAATARMLARAGVVPAADPAPPADPAPSPKEVPPTRRRRRKQEPKA